MAEERKGFNGERLKSARRYRSLNITELSELTGVSKQAISQFEHNKSEPKVETLLRIVNSLGFPREFFYQANRIDILSGDTYFRSLTATSLKERQVQIEYVKLLVEIYKGIEKYISFPKLNLYQVPHDFNFDVEELAKSVRNHWNLSETNNFNLIDVLERNGIIVNSLYTDTENIDAYSQIAKIGDTLVAIIVLGEDKESTYRRNFNVAHELGHLLLDDFFSVNDMSKIEYKEMEDIMNRFAGALLVPKDAYYNDLQTGNKTDLNFYIHLKLKYGVSAAALIVRARQLDMLTVNQYQYLMKQLSQKGYRRCEPFDKETELIKPRYLKAAMKMIIEEDKVTSKDFLETLHDNGCSLTSEIVENVLGLEEGYLGKNDSIPEIIMLNRK